MSAFSTRVNSIKDQVYNIIRDKIVYLELKPGEKIDENSITGLVGASRTPRREAMMMLEMDGYVKIYPQKGTYVSLIDLNLIREIIYTRYCLETNVFSELAKKKVSITPYIEKYLVLQEISFRENDFPEYINNDYGFHEKLFDLAGHSITWEIIKSKLHHTTRFRILGWKSVPDEFASTIQEHKEIVKYIEEGDVDNLKKILLRHHDISLSRYSAFLTDLNPQYFVH